MGAGSAFAAEAQRRAGAAFLGALLAAAAWAQSDKQLDLRLPPPDAPSAGGSVCRVCGDIRSIREVHIERPPITQTGVPTEHIGASPGTEDWRVVGAVAYLPLGGGTSQERWRFGAVGTPEMQEQLGESSYEITVLMDGGERRTIRRRDGWRFQVGQRVRLRSGELETMSP
jgi:outer membrane lipoprotein SlyB